MKNKKIIFEGDTIIIIPLLIGFLIFMIFDLIFSILGLTTEFMGGTVRLFGLVSFLILLYSMKVKKK